MATERYAPYPGVYGDMCDYYFDPRRSGVGGARSCFNKVGLRTRKAQADQCLEGFNQQNKRNFVLVDIVKLNSFNRYKYMTFLAREYETDERHYFRGIYNVFADRAELCEIKESGAAGLEPPPEHDDSYDPYSPENRRRFYLHCPKEWGLLPPPGLEDGAATSHGSDSNNASSASDSKCIAENAELVASTNMNNLSLSENSTPQDSINSSASDDLVQDIDKKIRAVKEKILFTQALQQKTFEKLEGWRNELKHLKDTKAKLVVPVRSVREMNS